MISKEIKFNGYNIPVLIKTERINNEIFRKNIIIDLMGMDDKLVIEILANHKDLQYEVVNTIDGDWFNNSNHNDKLIYLYNNEQENIVNKYKDLIMRDFKYYKKEFIDSEKFEKLNDSNIVINNSNKILVNNVMINPKGFNLIWGLNGSGKSILLREISDYYDAEIFEFSRKETIRLDNSEVFKKYYKDLTGRDEVVKYSSIDNVFYCICNGLAYGQMTESPVLFDDIGLGLMDDFNKFNVIDIFNEYSYSNGIFITSCKEDVKKLVKNRVYNPNIINL